MKMKAQKNAKSFETRLENMCILFDYTFALLFVSAVHRDLSELYSFSTELWAQRYISCWDQKYLLTFSSKTIIPHTFQKSGYTRQSLWEFFCMGAKCGPLFEKRIYISSVLKPCGQENIWNQNELTVLCITNLVFYFRYLVLVAPIAMAARSTAWTVFARSNAGIVGSKPTQGMNVGVHLFCV
jgi:hypothetical protein